MYLKNNIYKLLDEKNIWHEITEHIAVYNMEEVEKINLPHKECDAKNLFIRDDKKQNYYLITVRAEKRVNLKELKLRYNLRNLTFASAEDLNNIMGLIPGAVTPFGLLNDIEHKVTIFYLDKDFKEDDLIGVHPNDNTATIWLKTKDLLNILKEFDINIVLF